MAWDNQSCRAARPASIHVRQAVVRDMIVCRPSDGSGAPLTIPVLSSEETVAPIDCGRTPSARARPVTVIGPSRSRRLITDRCDEVRSPESACSRSLRVSLRRTSRISSARSEARALAPLIRELLVSVAITDTKLDYKGRLSNRDGVNAGRLSPAHIVSLSVIVEGVVRLTLARPALAEIAHLRVEAIDP